MGGGYMVEYEERIIKAKKTDAVVQNMRRCNCLASIFKSDDEDVLEGTASSDDIINRIRRTEEKHTAK